MAGLVDSHCHLTSDDLWPRADEVVARARQAGVEAMVTIATDLADADRALALASRHAGVHAVAGIHPHQAAHAVDGWAAGLEKIVARPDVFAVGEMGLDYHYDFAPRARQAEVFREQLTIAMHIEKPVVVHCREAHADTIAILAEFPRLAGVVFHCFTGTKGEATEILGRGYWISLTGVVTFKKSDEIREVARLLPADRFMIETDSPYLSPEPVRNVRPNEPAHLPHVARVVARERGLSPETLAEVTTANARRFFRLPV